MYKKAYNNTKTNTYNKINKKYKKNYYSKNAQDIYNKYYQKTAAPIVPGLGIPNQIMTKIKWINQLNVFGNPIGSIAYHNSIVNPDGTGTSGRPCFYDQYALLYNRYQVLGMKIKINVVQNNLFPCIIGLWWTNIQTKTSDPLVACENKFSQYQIMQGNPGGTTPASYNNQVITMKSYISTKKIIGAKNIMQDDLTSAIMGADPPNQYFVNVGVNTTLTTPQGTPARTIAVTGIVEITYFVRFYEPLGNGGNYMEKINEKIQQGEIKASEEEKALQKQIEENIKLLEELRMEKNKNEVPQSPKISSNKK